MQRHKLILLTIITCITTVYAGVGALDQSAAGVSARAVGLGQAVGSMYDDPANFIYNPATMATIIRPKTFLLSTKTLQEVNYINGGVIFPVEGIGVWGIAALNRNVTQIPLTDDFVFNGNEIDYESINYARYDENIYIIGYAQHLSLFERDFNWGLSTKVFQRTTTKVQDGTASGFNLDLGFAADVVPEVTVGLAYKNLLRGSSAGALLWATGEAEPMDAYLDLGISSTRLQKNVYVGLDLIKNTSRAAYPWNIRFGIEWHPLDALFVRGGVQQQYIASDIDNTSQMNITNAYSVGLGLNLYSWRLDYAYRPDTDIKELSSHWISLSLVGPEPCVVEAIPVITSGNQTPTPAEIITESALVLLSPDNRTVTTARQIVVMGMVYQELACVVNGQEYPLTKNNVFAVPVALALGLNDITLSTPQKKTTIGLKVLCLANFADISDSTYKDAIVTMATLGYMSGDYPDRFNPQRYVSRAEMADIVVRMQRLSTPVQLRAIMDSVDMLSAQGLLKGYPDGLMRPEERLTLGQLSLVLARLQNLPFKTMTSTVGYLAQDHWSEQAVAALVETQLYTLADFSPRNAPVTKEKLAYFLSRLPIVQDSTTRLNNFETFVAAEQSAVFFMHKPGVETVQSDEDIFNRLIGDDANKLLPSAIDQTEMLGSRLQKPTPNQTILKKTIVATAPDRQKYILLRNKGIIDNQPPEYLLNQQELAVILKRVYGLSLETQTQSLVSRAYAIALIVRAEKLSLTSNDLAPYKDVNTKNWAYRQIAVAKAKGFLPKGDYLKPFQAIDLQTLAIYLANTPTVKKKLSAQ